MSESTVPAQPTAGDVDEKAALFASLVIQQANMASMLLGSVPHPESGQPVKDLEAAKLFIDHLEMLEVKTKGNLSKDESALLKQTLMNLRLAFVAAVEEGGKTTAPAAGSGAESPGKTATAASEAKPAVGAEAGAPAPAEEETRKKFTKKY